MGYSAFNDRRFSEIIPRMGGDVSKVNPLERPDIVDPESHSLYEIKPEGREKSAMDDADYYQQQLKNAGVNVQLGSSDADGTMGSFDWELYHINYESRLPGVITYSLSYRPLIVPVPMVSPGAQGAFDILQSIEGIP